MKEWRQEAGEITVCLYERTEGFWCEVLCDKECDFVWQSEKWYIREAT